METTNTTANNTVQIIPQGDGHPEMRFYVGYDVIGKIGEGQRVTMFDDWTSVNAAYMGLLDASVGAYPILDDGLHLKIAMEERGVHPFRKNIGYIAQDYAPDQEFYGDFKHLLASIPPYAWASIDLVGGMPVVGMVCLPYPKQETDGKFVRFSRAAFYKHAILRLMLENKPVSLKYSTNLPWMVTEIAEFHRLIALNTTDRAVALEHRRLTRKDYFETKDKTNITKKDNFTGFYNPKTEVMLRTREVVKVVDLIGKWVQKWDGVFDIGVAFPITAENASVTAEVAADCGHVFEVVAAPTTIA